MRNVQYLGVILVIAGVVFFSNGVCAGGNVDDWYTEGDLEPATRVRITLYNPLDFDRVNCPVVISRFKMPI